MRLSVGLEGRYTGYKSTKFKTDFQITNTNDPQTINRYIHNRKNKSYLVFNVKAQKQFIVAWLGHLFSIVFVYNNKKRERHLRFSKAYLTFNFVVSCRKDPYFNMKNNF